MRRVCTFLLLALSFAIPTHAKAKRPKKKPKVVADERGPFRLETRSHVAGGYFYGIGTRRVRDGFAEVDARLTPAYVIPSLRIAAPARIAYRHPFQVSYSELRAGIDLELGWRVSPHLRLVPQAGLRGVLRPGWPDPYQPQPDGTLGSSDRYSYWERHWGWRVVVFPLRRQRATLAYEYRLFDYRADSLFDPLGAPTHLAPRDRAEHVGALSWDWSLPRLKLDVDLRGRYRSDFFAFARDAGTGRTHAASGGLPPNPLATYWGLEPGARAAFAVVPRRLWLELGYAHEIWVDPFQGYYSNQGPRVTLGARATFPKVLRVEAEASHRLLRYGPNSYAPGTGHPALEDGTRLTDQRTRFKLRVVRPLGAGFELFGAAEATLRRSNYPDYVPFVFPASRAYAIDWDYDNAEASIGLALATN